MTPAKTFQKDCKENVEADEIVKNLKQIKYEKAAGKDRIFEIIKLEKDATLNKLKKLSLDALIKIIYLINTRLLKRIQVIQKARSATDHQACYHALTPTITVNCLKHKLKLYQPKGKADFRTGFSLELTEAVKKLHEKERIVDLEMGYKKTKFMTVIQS